MVTRRGVRDWLGLVLGVAALLPASPAGYLRAADGEKVRVTVVAILATDRNATVDPRVKCIAEEVQKLEPSLTGFRLARTTCKSLPVAQKESFPLVEDETATVFIHSPADKENRVALTLKPPLGGEITYITICGKFFPIMTRYQTKDKDRLILAVMVRPCNGKP